MKMSKDQYQHFVQCRAEIAELVGLFLLSKLQHLNLDLGLYRDDGLGICSQRPRQVEKIKQEMCRIFQTFNLKITIDVNHKVVNFLDITLDLDSELYKPHMKPNDTPLYVDKHSNHPPSIIHNLPAGIKMRLSNNSANEEFEFRSYLFHEIDYVCELKHMCISIIHSFIVHTGFRLSLGRGFQDYLHRLIKTANY